MSKNRTLVLTVVRHGQTDSNKEKLMQGLFVITKSNFTSKLWTEEKIRLKKLAEFTKL